MNDDRELLELAAKAAGMTEYVYCELACGSPALYCKKANLGMWAPLIDDGDAFRLAVKLRLDICTEDNDPHPTENRQVSHVNVWPFSGGIGASEDLNNPDPYAATRRAIVRAAAGIGRSMKG